VSCATPGEPATLQPSAAGPSALQLGAHASRGCQDHSDEADSISLRELARRPLRWKKYDVPAQRELAIQLLGFNDFHGQLSPKTVSMRMAGGAAVFASYLYAAAAGQEDRTLIVHAGDLVGASPPNSALLQDEPSIQFLNLLADRDCRYGRARPGCNVVGTLGNHEFDEGSAELLRLLRGGDHPNGPFLESPWRGARAPYVSANVVDAASGEPLIEPYLIKRVHGIGIGFIGAVLKNTPSIVTPTGVAGLSFLDEAEAINRYVKELQAKGVHSLVVVIHQGLTQPSYEGVTSPTAAAPSGELLDVISRLDPDIDVIVSGHTHQFSNALLPNSNGEPVLVTQAFSAGTAYADIDLTIDTASGDVVAKSAQVITTWGDEGPGLTPDSAVAELVAQADARVAPLVGQVVAESSAEITRTQNAAGESALGDLIADSQRAAVGADFGVMNPGGIRADLPAGQLTWGQLFTVQPFGNTVVKLTLTGQQIYDLLDQQWGDPQPAGGRVLQISGFGYSWDSSVAEGGARVTEVHDASGTPIDRAGSYSVAANNFIAAGGDNFSVLTLGSDQLGGPVDLDAFIDFLKALPQPFSAPIADRITSL
jgi:5'-nucleotidase